MSDSGRVISECRHGNLRITCKDCEIERLSELAKHWEARADEFSTLNGELSTELHAREMYEQELIVECESLKLTLGSCLSFLKDESLYFGWTEDPFKRKERIAALKAEIESKLRPTENRVE